MNKDRKIEFATETKEMVKMSCQDPWNETETCSCGNEAELTMTVFDDGKLCHKHKNDYKNPNEGFWFHDKVSVAIYTCRKCFKMTTLWNQY